MGKRFSIWIILALGTVFAGCAGQSRLALDYGTSVRLAKYNQTLNPQAEKNLEPVTGLDGEAAKAVTEKFRKDFEKPAPLPFTIHIGKF